MANQLSAQPKGRTRELINGESGQHPLLLERNTPIPYSSPSVNSRECLIPPCAFITSWFHPIFSRDIFVREIRVTSSQDKFARAPPQQKKHNLRRRPHRRSTKGLLDRHSRVLGPWCMRLTRTPLVLLHLSTLS